MLMIPILHIFLKGNKRADTLSAPYFVGVEWSSKGLPLKRIISWITRMLQYTCEKRKNKSFKWSKVVLTWKKWDNFSAEDATEN